MSHRALRPLFVTLLSLPLLLAAMLADAGAIRIRHIAEVVGDLDRSIAFYSEALGFRLVAGPERLTPESDAMAAIAGAPVRRATLALGSETITLEEYGGSRGARVPATGGATDLWFQHFAIVVADMDRAAAHLARFTPTAISSGPQTIPADNVAAAGIRAYKFRDPDGHPLELLWFPRGKGDVRWQEDAGGRLFLGIDHSAITIADTKRSTTFYRDVLGLQVRGGGLNSGDTQDRLDGLAGARVRITGLHPPAPDGPGLEFLDYLQPSGGRPFPTGTGIADPVTTRIILEVDDLGATAARLGQAGIPTLTPPPTPGTPATLVVRDPDGHGLQLVEH